LKALKRWQIINFKIKEIVENNRIIEEAKKFKEKEIELKKAIIRL